MRSLSTGSGGERHDRTRQRGAPAREYRLAGGRPPASTLLLADDDGQPWDKAAWQMWRVDRWAPACLAVGLDPIPRPYDLRHSFASLLLAEGRQPLYVAKQLGHSLTVLLTTYAHLIDEYAERHPEGALSVPLADIAAGTPTVLPDDREAPIVTICKVGERSLSAMLLLKAYGYRHVTSVRGGLDALVNAGLETASSNSAA